MKVQKFDPFLRLLTIAILVFSLVIPAGTGLAVDKPVRPAPASPDIDFNPAAGIGEAPEASLPELPIPAGSVNAALTAGAARLAALQNLDGGWDWPLDDGNPASISPKNTFGPIGMGLAKGYWHSGDAAHRAALLDAGTLLLTKTNNFSPSDGYLAAELDRVFGGTTYVNHVTANFYGPLAAGTYNRNGAGTLYDTAAYVNLIRTVRSGTQANLAAWDLGMGLVGAAAAGAETAPWVAGVKAEIDELNGDWTVSYYDVIGLAGAVYGLAYVGEDHDPIAGEHEAASSLADLAAILASYQITGGGFAWNSAYVIPNDANEAIQETAYAVLALSQVNRSLYLEAIQGAAEYMLSVQLATGGWAGDVLSTENNEITGEALWGIHVAAPEVWVAAGSGNDANSGERAFPKVSIQAGIDAVASGGTVNVLAGSYSETASNRYLYDGSGPYQFGLFIGAAKPGITVQGVDASGARITSFASALATVTTNATNGFGPSGFFIEGDDATISGLIVGANAVDQNKTIEVLGDNFSLKYCDLADLGGSVYLNDWRYDDVNDISHLQSYRIEGNNFQDGLSLDIASGAGYSGPVSGRVIMGNTFTNNAGSYWPFISFSGSDTGVPWFLYSVGGAQITGNTFNNTDPTGQHIRARGTYDNSQFDWASYWNNNTFNKAVIVGAVPPADVRTYSYPNTYGTFNNVRRIGAIVQPEIDNALAGDTVLAKDGVYVEQVEISKDLTLRGAGAGTIVRSPDALTKFFTTSGLNNYPVVYAHDAAAVTIRDLKVDGAGKGNANYRFQGIGFYNAGGEVQTVEITDVRDTPFSGAQHGVALYAYNADGTPRSLTVTGVTIHDFQKNGMALMGAGLTVDVNNSQVTGYGPTTVTAQNGIQVSSGASGVIGPNASVSGVSYTPGPWTASGMLIHNGGTVNVLNSSVSQSQTGVYFWGTSGTLANNTVYANSAGVGTTSFWGVIAGDPPRALPSVFDQEQGSLEAVPDALQAALSIAVNDNLITSDGNSTSSTGLDVNAGYDADDVSFSATGNTLSNWGYGMAVWQATDSTGLLTSFAANQNCISGNTSFGMYAEGFTANLNAENNYWGAGSGPTHASNPTGTGDAVSDYVDFQPWLTTCGGSAASWMNMRTGEINDLQPLLNGALPGDEIRFIGIGPVPGGATASQNGLTINLNGGTFGPGSPFLIVDADNVTVLGPGTLDGNGSLDPAILVLAGADNFTMQNVEVREWADGVQIAGAVTSFKLVNNFIHDNVDAGLQVDAAATLGGVVTIEGNLFKDNGGNGVQNDNGTALDATYNSWGSDAGPVSGDGASANVISDPWTFAELYLDMVPDTEAEVRSVLEGDSFDVAIKGDAENLYGLSFKFSYDPTLLQFNSTTFSFPWIDRCFPVGAPPAGTVHYQCALISGAEWDGGTIATFNFTATGSDLTGDGPWTDVFDVSHLVADTSAGAVGGVKVFVNNAGFNAPSDLARDITDLNDGQVDITGLANFTGFIDLQGRANDSGATLTVYDQLLKAGSTALASASSATSGAYTTAYLGSYQLAVGSAYYFQVDAPLYLPTTQIFVGTAETDWANGGTLTDRPLTPLAGVVLLGGDATNDDVIGIDDATCVGADYGTASSTCVGVSASSDVNGDGRIDILDLVLMGGNFDLLSSPWSQTP